MQFVIWVMHFISLTQLCLFVRNFLGIHTQNPNRNSPLTLARSFSLSLSYTRNMTHSFTRFPLLLLLCWQLHYDYWILHWRKFVIRLLHVCESVCVCMYVVAQQQAQQSWTFTIVWLLLLLFLYLPVSVLHFQALNQSWLFQPSRVNHEELLSHCEVVFAPLFLWMLSVMVVLLLLLLLCFFVLYDWPTDWPSRRYSSIAAPAKTGLATNSIASAVHLCVVCVCVCAIVSINRDFMRSLHSRAQRSADIAAVANLSVHTYIDSDISIL